MAVREQLQEQNVNSINTPSQENCIRQPLATLVNCKSTPTFAEFTKTISSDDLPLGWRLIKTNGSIKVVYLQERKKECTKDPMITKSITMNDDRSWSLRVLDRTIANFDSPGCESLQNYQNLETREDLLKLVNVVHSSKICCGNPDIELPTGREVTVNSTAVSRETMFEVEAQGSSCFNSTIRSSQCSLLTQTGKYINRCNECIKQRTYLRVIKSRQAKSPDTNQRIAVDSHINYRYLSSVEKDKKIRKLHQELKATKRTLYNVQSKLHEAIAKEGHILDNEMNSYFKEILANGEHLEDEFPNGTFRRFFWQQQMLVSSCSDSRQIRWHPLMVKWCLNIKLRSTSAFTAMRNSGFLKLPSERTLRDYTHWTKMTSGFQPSSFERLLVEAKYDDLEEWQKFVVLLHDEIKIKSDLVYCKHTGELIGFANLGDVNNSLVDFEKQCQNEIANCTPDIATYILAFMVRGVSTRLEYPLAHFPCSGCTSADLIYPLFWDGVRYLETLGFKVIAGIFGTVYSTSTQTIFDIDTNNWPHGNS